MGPSSQDVEDTKTLEEAILAEISSLMVSWTGLQVSIKEDEENQEVLNSLGRGLIFRTSGQKFPNGLPAKGGSWKQRESSLTRDEKLSPGIEKGMSWKTFTQPIKA